MIISALDYSINSPGVVRFILDDNLQITRQDYITFTQSKKFQKIHQIYYFKKDQFKNNFDQNMWISDVIMSFIGKSEYLALEGYAFGISRNGMVFDIAEGCGNIKYQIYNKHIPIRIYDPNTIKMFATTSGAAKKEQMEEAFEKQDDKIDISFLPSVKDKASNNPKDNIVDAWWICKLLQLELQLRRGLLLLKDLDEEKIKIFNRVTKKNPENILVTNFIQKDKV